MARMVDLFLSYENLEEDQKVFQRYRLKRLLAKTPATLTWLALDEETGEEAAVRFLPDFYRSRQKDCAEIREVAERCARIEHPNISRIRGFQRDYNYTAVIQDYTEGQTLAERLAGQEGGFFEPSQLADWLSQFCQAMAHAHGKHSQPHMNLHPGLLKITAGGRLKIEGFGISRCVADRIHATLSGEPGRDSTPYISPQMLRGDPPRTQDDCYAAGAILFELLTGSPVFGKDNLAFDIENKKAPAAAETRQFTGIGKEMTPAAWSQTVAACLSKDPAKRPADGAALARSLEIPIMEAPDGIVKPAPEAIEPTAAEEPAPPETPETPAREEEPPPVEPEKETLTEQAEPPPEPEEAPPKKMPRAEEEAASAAAPETKQQEAPEPPPPAAEEDIPTPAEKETGAEPAPATRAATEKTRETEAAETNRPPEKKPPGQPSPPAEKPTPAPQESPPEPEKEPAKTPSEQESTPALPPAPPPPPPPEATAVKKKTRQPLEPSAPSTPQKPPPEPSPRPPAKAEKSPSSFIYIAVIIILLGIIAWFWWSTAQPLKTPSGAPQAAGQRQPEEYRKIIIQHETPPHAETPLAAVPEVTLTFTSNLPETEIFLGDESLGIAPIEASLPAGEYTFTAVNPPWEDLSLTAQVDKNLKGPVSFNFPSGTVNVATNPPGAEVLLGKIPLGKTPLELARVKPGPVVYHLSHPDYQTQTVKGEVPDGDTLRISVRLVKSGFMELAYRAAELARPPEVRLDKQIRVAVRQYQLGQRDDALAKILEAVLKSEDLPSGTETDPTGARGRRRVLLAAYNAYKKLGLAGTAAGLIEKIQDPALRMRLYEETARNYLRDGKTGLAAEAGEKALAAARQTKEVRAISQSLDMAARIHILAGHPGKAADLREENYKLLRRHKWQEDERHIRVLAYIGQAQTSFLAGEAAKGFKQFKTAEKLNHHLQDHPAYPRIVEENIRTEFIKGDVDNAIQLAHSLNPPEARESALLILAREAVRQEAFETAFRIAELVYRTPTGSSCPPIAMEIVHALKTRDMLDKPNRKTDRLTHPLLRGRLLQAYAEVFRQMGWREDMYKVMKHQENIPRQIQSAEKRALYLLKNADLYEWLGHDEKARQSLTRALETEAAIVAPRERFDFLTRAAALCGRLGLREKGLPLLEKAAAIPDLAAGERLEERTRLAEAAAWLDTFTLPLDLIEKAPAEDRPDIIAALASPAPLQSGLSLAAAKAAAAIQNLLANSPQDSTQAVQPAQIQPD